ncbi:Ig-like domain-containing protein [Winogradskyella sp. 3972H.M.0a.05]|uniref:Ig-like domain-containing protein n=1 Tax=Winogradskyella sp. 3972H.M.0a.05 TaxID=2950277 RepID=UPI003396AD01
MNIKKRYWVFILPLIIASCIGEDIIADFIEPELRITNPITEIAISESYQFDIVYFNNIGQEENADIDWTSSNTSVATIDSNGLLMSITEGNTIITASTTIADQTIEESFPITVTTEPDNTQQPIVKSGTIATTSSYLLQGSFTLSELEDSNDLLLSFEDDYQADTALPGLYVYLTNNPSSIANAQSLGPVNIFNGQHQYVIPNTGINDFSHLLYWCEPFSVKVGDGTIED